MARVRNVAQRQQLLQEAARFADTDMGQMAKRSRNPFTAGSGEPFLLRPVVHSFTPREASVLQLVAEG